VRSSIRAWVGVALTGSVLLPLGVAVSRGAPEDAAPASKPPADLKPVKLVTLPAYTEGVVFDRDGNGYCSHDKTVTRFTLDGKHATWAETGGPNGHKVLADGTHLLCDRSHRAVLRLSAEGKLLDPPAASAVEGKPLQGPNDLTLDAPNGGFYFTDPENSSADKPIGAVYYVDATDGTGKVRRVDDGLAYPNGIVLTPDGKRLYVGESQRNRVHVYDVTAPGEVANRRVFAELPTADKAAGQIDNQPDGMCLDAAGNLYVAHYGMRQVQVLNPAGKLIARLPGGNLTTSNVAFGGPKADQLFVTGALAESEGGKGAVFRLDVGVKGLRVLPGSE
jgi:gluconolactonase